MKYKINMLSKADSVDGQGVGSAYIEQVRLVREMLSDQFEVVINSHKKADIVHVHSVNPGFYFRFRKKKGARVMYCHFLPETLEGSIHLPKLFFWVFKKYVLSFYKKAEHLVVVNPIFIEDLVKLGVRREHIHYIPNYVSKENFYPLSSSQILEIRKKYQIDPDRFVVLGCGQVQTRKGVLDFVEVAKKNPDKTFVWCGGFSFAKITDGYKELKEIMDHPPVENLKFLGIIPRTEMNQMFNMADCLFMPSYNELFPMSILEAVSCNRPVVLRDLELYKNILWDQYLSGNNNEEFFEIIDRLATDSAYYEEAVKKAQTIAQYYSKENVASLWREFYLSLVSPLKK